MNPIIRDILNDYQKIWSIHHAEALLNWDLETYMPEQGAKRRGDASAQLALMEQSFFLSLKERVERASTTRIDRKIRKGIF